MCTIILKRERKLITETEDVLILKREYNNIQFVIRSAKYIEKDICIIDLIIIGPNMFMYKYF